MTSGSDSVETSTVNESAIAVLENVLQERWRLNNVKSFLNLKQITIQSLKNDVASTMLTVAKNYLPLLSCYKSLIPETIFASKYLSFVLDEVIADDLSSPHIAQMHTAWVSCVSELLCSRRSNHQKLARRLCCHLWNYSPVALDLLFSNLLSPNHFEISLPVASLACIVRREDESVKKLEKHTILQNILDYAFSGKKDFSTHYLEHTSGLLNYCIDESTFRNCVLPVIHRKLLRSPETAVLVVDVILKQLVLNFDECGVEFTQPLANNLLSTSPIVRASSVSSIVSLVKHCTDPNVVSAIYNLVLSKLTGPEGRRVPMDVKLAILDTLGNLSLHNADNSTVFPDVLKSLIDIFTSEVNEDIIESVLIQLGMWIKRPKCVLPEKAQATIRDKLFAAKTSHRVKMAIFRCIEEVLRSGGKLSKTYIPLLATMAQGAKTEVPTSPLVSQAVAAASLWLMNVSQPGKAPECMWAVLSGLKADGKPANEKESLPMWLSDRFLLTASSDVHSYLVNCIHLLLTNHPNELSRHQRSVFYRSLILVWLYTESVNVVSDIRCCLLLHLAREGKQTRTLGQALIEDHLNALVQESLIKTASGTPDLLVSASANVARFGQRLVRLVETICRGASASSSQVSNPSIGGSRLAASSINLPKLEALSSRQRTSLFSAALYALSHPASVAHINSAWLNLIRILNLPQHADVEPTFTEDESAPVFEKVVDTLVKLPKLDVAHRLMLQRLLQWAPVKAGSCLARKLHSDLLKPEYLDVTLDEVGIMLTPPGLLHNQALLASLPRYQMNKTNVKRESKLYSHEIEMEILEAQAAKKRQKQTTADGEQSFLESIAPQLTVKQLELVKAEMEKEEVIRLRIAKLYAVGSHKMDLLTILHDTLLRCSNVEGIQLAFLQRNSFALCDLTTRLLACPLLSPLAIGAHSRLARLIAEVAMRASVVDRTELCRKAFLFAAWSIRILGPARVCLEEKPPVASFCQTSSVDEQSVRAENAAWNAFSRIGDIKDQTELVLESLLSDLPSATVSSALLISAAVPMFIRILHNNTLFTSVENEEKKWADVYIFSKFIAALKKQVAFHDSVGKSSESYESVCASLQFQRIYEFSLDLIDEIGQALESSLVGEDSGLSASICELLQSTTQLHTEYFLHILESGHTQKDSLLVACTPTIYTLLERLVSFTPLTRATAMTCMIAFAKCLPECFTHNLCSPSPPHIKAAVTDNDSTIQETDQKEGVAKISSTNTMGKSAGGNLNKSQKKKKKKAALEASSNMAMGCIGLSMNEGLADPANWPPLTLFANTQLRLFVSRCDPSVEVAIDAESLWLRLGLRACCELEEELESDNDRTSDRRLVLLSQPHNPSALQPTALATRLLLESIRTPVDIQMATASALQRCVNGKSQEEIQHVLDYWLEIYRCLMEKPQSKTDMYGKPVTPSPSKYTSQRIGLARALAAIVGCSRSPGYYPNLRLDNGDVTISSAAPTTAVIDGASIKQQKAGAWLQKIFRFLVDEGLHDPDEEVRYALLQAGLAATREYGVTNLQQMLQVLEAFLNKAPNVAELDMVRQSVVVLLGSLAKYLGPDDPRVGSIFSRLLSAVSFPADVVQKAVEDCLSPLAPKLPPDQLEKTFPRLLSTLFSSMGYAERRGAAYALAGIVRGCGVTTLKQHNIIDKLLNALESKNSKHKESALFAFERLSLALGRIFEPYVVKLIPQLLNCFGDSNLGVREAASVTSQAVMSKLSAHGIKLILPILLKVIDEDSPWRTKCQAVEVLATMTSCAPKQLSSCLPQIVPRILNVLIDSQEGVKKAGANALEHIGTVIRNPEIQALVPCLIKSLQDPLADKMTCLLTLRDTCFTHIVDAASLALIMPVLQRAFDDRSTEIRKIAAQIFGTLYSLARKEDLEPYIPRILPGLRGCLLDPVPEVRSVTARALGAMVKGIGEACSKDLLPWLISTLTSEQSSVDRSGAAQGLAEVLGGMGLSRLQSILPDFIRTAEATNIQPFVRDGYLMLFIYLPEVFRNEFSPFITPVLSPILKALADECEYLRETALKAGQRIIDLFANEAVKLLLPELEKGLLSVDWRIRHSSLQLIGDLLYKLSGVSGKGTTKTADEDDTFGTDVASSRILKALGEERRNRVLARLHIARSDPTYLVRNAASHIWKIVVVNTPRTLRELMPILVQLLLTTLGSGLREHQQVAGRALGDLVRKLGDRVLPEVIPHLEEGLNSPDDNKRRGVCNGLIEIMRNCQSEQIVSFSDHLTSPIRRSLTDPSPEVRKAGARAFDLLYSGIHLRAVDDILPDMFVQLDDPRTKEDALDGIRQLLALRGRAVMPYLVPKLTQPRLDAKTFAFLAPIAGDTLTRHLVRILPSFLQAASEVPATEKESSDLGYCTIVLTSIGDITGVRLILQELISGLSLTDSASASQISVPGLKPNSTSYCYASLRLLHVYLDSCFTIEETTSASPGINLSKPVANQPVKTRKVSNEQEDSDDEDDDSNVSYDEESDSESDLDENAEDEEDFQESESEDARPDPKKIVQELMPDYYPSLLRYLTRLLTVNDDSILTYSWACLESVLKYWSAVSMSATQVHELRQALKSALGEFLRSQSRLTLDKQSSQQHSRQEILIPGFSKPGLPLPSLVRFYAECILRGHPDAKEPAAQGLAECVALSSGAAIQPCVIKVLGPMIRLLGERQPSAIKSAIVESLAALIEKCPTSTRPFTPQLQATFTKALGDSHRQIRLLGGRGLSNLATMTPKLDVLLVDLSNAAASPFKITLPNPPVTPSVGPHVQVLAAAGAYPDTTLQALRLCLEKSKGKPKLATLQTVLGYVVPMGRLAEASGSIDEEVASLVFVRRAARACVGAALASAASTSDTAFRDVSSLVPWCQASSDSPLVQQANAQALMVMLKLVPTALLQVHAEEFKSRTLRTVSDCCMSNDIGVRQAGLRALGFSLAASLEASAAEEDVAMQVQLLARSFKLDLAEDRVLAANVACYVASQLKFRDSSGAPPKWLLSFVGLIASATKDKNLNVCAAAEEAIVSLCRIGTHGGDKNEVYSLCLNCLDPGKRNLLEEVVGRLKKQSWTQFWLRGPLDIDNTIMEA